MKKVELKMLFSGLQNQMTAQLSTNREFINHPGSKGDSLENAWIEWLRAYLPNRYSVDKAIVIDYTGQTSQQIDIVIYDNWFTPFIFTQNGFHYIPAEGVYAVFEVKPDFNGSVPMGKGKKNKDFITYAAEKIESVRVLKRTSVDMIASGNTVFARPLTKIVGGILASTNTYKRTGTISKILEKQKGFKSIDFGCAADYGSFFVEYNGSEDLSLSKPKDFEKRITDYYNGRQFVDVSFSKPENSMVTFFMQLSRYLQQAIGTVAAIDLQAYLDKINEKIDDEI
ncbi:DUF6602 domain-containing protein [Sphingobacterium siyangense]|uniref:DUF6602 domain-containing protein n=1 Tax=Sphingobacterium siyangense TaxID=459529 RepID=UPI003DA445AB